MYHRKWLHKFGTAVVVAGLVLSSSAAVFAQSGEEDAEPAGGALIQVDPSFWEESALEHEDTPRPEEDVVALPDSKDSTIDGSQNRVYLPSVSNSGDLGMNGAAFGPNDLRIPIIILSEGFEGVWPPSGGKWTVKDYNGSLGGSFVWDDVNFQHRTGNRSAQPADSNVYPNNLFSIMEYGPFSLPGANVSSADFTFYYKLRTGSGLDFLSWSYSCDNGFSWIGESKSGSTASTWKQAKLELSPCLGKSTIRVRITFTSDTANICFVDPCSWDVYVDDVFISYKKIF